MTTIGTSTTLGVVINDNSYSNPIVIQAGVTIANSAGGDAVATLPPPQATPYTIENSGTVDATGSTSVGIYLQPGGAVTNAASASITGVADGISVAGGYGTVVNDSTIASTGTGLMHAGVYLFSGGIVTNASSAAITGNYDGVRIFGGLGTLFNNGVVAGGTSGFSDGVYMTGGGEVTNAATATIQGAHALVVGGATANLVNYGMITALGTSGSGVQMSARATVSNAVTGTISGAAGTASKGHGVYIIGSPGTVYNAGLIQSFGNSYASAVDLERTYSYLSNAATGRIVAADGDGVESGGDVANAGTITAGGANGNGVYLPVGGIVTNSGTIVSAKRDGVETNQTLGNLVNSGLIEAEGSNSNYDAVNLRQGGYVTNLSTGRIIATAENAIYITQITIDATVLNAGTISSGQRDGVFFLAPGAVTNQPGGMIYGATAGVYGEIAGLSVVNLGTIRGANLGVQLVEGGQVTNDATAMISSSARATIYVTRAAGGVVNAGDIVNTGGKRAINLTNGGSVANQSGATVSGGLYAVDIGGTTTTTGTVVNAGVIRGTSGSGVFLQAGGSVTNLATGTIAGSAFGVTITGATGTVVNAGSIISADTADAAVRLAPGHVNRVIVDPGALFVGAVNGGNSIASSIVSTLELASGASAGTLGTIGTQYLNFGAIVFDAGAQWSIAGDTAGLAGTISGFAPGDTIEVTGVTSTGSIYVGGALTLDTSGSPVVLHLPGSFATTNFHIGHVSGGTDITVACFRAGTRVLTARGEVAVEDLLIGEPVAVRTGFSRITWIGHRRVDCRRHPRPQAVWPVRVAAGAFGEQQPLRDLWLSPDHAVYLNDVLIPIRHLVDGRGITQVPVDEVLYYHVELPRHEVLLAEGLPCESFLDTGNRSAFADSDGSKDGALPQTPPKAGAFGNPLIR